MSPAGPRPEGGRAEPRRRIQGPVLSRVDAFKSRRWGAATAQSIRWPCSAQTCPSDRRRVRRNG